MTPRRLAPRTLLRHLAIGLFSTLVTLVALGSVHHLTLGGGAARHDAPVEPRLAREAPPSVSSDYL